MIGQLLFAVGLAAFGIGWALAADQPRAPVMAGGIVVALVGAALWVYAERAKRDAFSTSDNSVTQPGDSNVAVRGNKNTVIYNPPAAPPRTAEPDRESPDLVVQPLLGQEPEVDLLRMRPTGRTMDFVWLNVKNRAHRALGDATNVWAVINFPTFEMSPARWRDSPDPLRVADWGEISDRKTIRAGQTRQLDVAYRTEGDRTGYALNSEAMQPQYGWRRPGWALDPGEHVVTIRLSADNAPIAYYRLILRLPESGPFEVREFVATEAPTS